jgi:protein-S-isoprenylcysteine O-methyltransferase Ste14
MDDLARTACIELRGLAPVALVIASIVWRLIDEDDFLARNLSGYGAYRGRVRARLMPAVW